MEKQLISAHTLKTDYSMKGKIRTVIIGWVIYGALFGVTRMPSVQAAMLGFAENVRVEWVTDVVSFVIDGLWFVVIPMVIGTLMTLLKKQTFDELRIYNEGLGFANSKTGEETYAAYASIHLSYGKLQDSFWVEAKEAGVKLTEFGWKEFAEPTVLRTGLEEKGKWN